MITTETNHSSVSVAYFNQMNDHVKACRLLYKQGILSKVDKVIAIFLLGFGIYCVVVAGIIWWSVLWFPLAIVEWFDLLSFIRFRTILWFRWNPKFREEYHLTFSPDDIHFKTATIDSTLQWTHYESVIEGEGIFLLMYGKGLYTLIPARCFTSQAQLEAFRNLARSKAPEYKTMP